MLATLIFCLLPSRRRRIPAALALLLAGIALAFVSGCGGGSSSSSGSGGGGVTTHGGTTIGAYTVTVNASDAATGKVTATTTVSLTVN